MSSYSEEVSGCSSSSLSVCVDDTCVLARDLTDSTTLPGVLAALSTVGHVLSRGTAGGLRRPVAGGLWLAGMWLNSSVSACGIPGAWEYDGPGSGCSVVWIPWPGRPAPWYEELPGITVSHG